MKNRVHIILKVLAFLILLGMKQGYWPWTGDLSRWDFSFDHPGITSVLNFVIFLLGLDLATHLLKSLYRRRKGLQKGANDNVLLGIDNIRILVFSMAVVVLVLGFFGIDPKTLLTGLSIVAAAIAIVTREYITNIIGGIAISFSDEISIGDYIRMDAFKGRVTDITITRIALLTNDDEIVYIPHTKIFTSEVVNYTKSGIRRVSIEFEISIEALTTVETFEQDLIENISEYHDHIESGSFWLKIQEIHKDSVGMKFQFVLKAINRRLELEIRKKTVRTIVNHIRRHQR